MAPRQIADRSRKAAELAKTESDDRWMGRIEERLDGMIEEARRVRERSTEVLTETRLERDRAEAHRQAVLDGMSVLNNTVRVLANEVESMKPVVADYKEKLSEGRGMARLGNWIWAGVGAIVASAIAVFTGGRFPGH